MPLHRLTVELTNEIARAYPSLRTLNLSHNNLRELGEHLHPLKYIRALDVCHNSLETFKGIGALPSLDTLIAHHNSISVMSLDDALEMSRVSTLDLADNSISSIESVESLRNCPHLQSLRLNGNPIVESMKQYREYVLQLLPSLENLDGVPVTDTERTYIDVWSAQKEGMTELKESVDDIVREPEEGHVEKAYFSHILDDMREKWMDSCRTVDRLHQQIDGMKSEMERKEMDHKEQLDHLRTALKEEQETVYRLRQYVDEMRRSKDDVPANREEELTSKISALERIIALQEEGGDDMCRKWREEVYYLLLERGKESALFSEEKRLFEGELNHLRAEMNCYGKKVKVWKEKYATLEADYRISRSNVHKARAQAKAERELRQRDEDGMKNLVESLSQMKKWFYTVADPEMVKLKQSVNVTSRRLGKGEKVMSEISRRIMKSLRRSEDERAMNSVAKNQAERELNSLKKERRTEAQALRSYYDSKLAEKDALLRRISREQRTFMSTLRQMENEKEMLRKRLISCEEERDGAFDEIGRLDKEREREVSNKENISEVHFDTEDNEEDDDEESTPVETVNMSESREERVKRLEQLTRSLLADEIEHQE